MRLQSTPMATPTKPLSAQVKANDFTRSRTTRLFLVKPIKTLRGSVQTKKGSRSLAPKPLRIATFAAASNIETLRQVKAETTDTFQRLVTSTCVKELIRVRPSSSFAAR